MDLSELVLFPIVAKENIKAPESKITTITIHRIVASRKAQFGAGPCKRHVDTKDDPAYSSRLRELPFALVWLLYSAGGPAIGLGAYRRLRRT